VNVADFSRRRGAIVHLLPQMYALIKEEGGGNVPHYHLWNHDMSRILVDISHKWLFALEEPQALKGMLLYCLGSDGRSVYINHLISARDNPDVLKALLLKFEREDSIKGREVFYISRSVKREAADEVLETVGLQDDSAYDDAGYQNLGGLGETIKALKLRYLR